MHALAPAQVGVFAVTYIAYTKFGVYAVTSIAYATFGIRFYFNFVYLLRLDIRFYFICEYRPRDIEITRSSAE